MNVREMLELAAKAAGLIGRWTDSDQHFRLPDGFAWNPLDDDGDALRLAVKLKIWPMPSIDCCEARVSLGSSQEEIVTVWLSETDNDPYAAIRLAIVRAAAEIGRRMK